jgi:hypothetical protein
MVGISQLIKALPKDYEIAAKEQGALIRARGIKNPGDLIASSRRGRARLGRYVVKTSGFSCAE